MLIVVRVLTVSACFPFYPEDSGSMVDGIGCCGCTCVLWADAHEDAHKSIV